ncbi:MAG: serine hydroxymethyltransferase [bacterium]|nr:serine hydroxymethyltransferase [bacterium]MCX7917224.1 serine hydroxymethyltransferase [bacterium]MDW8164649.1 serine hydroxymethyltransferase [Candidatus Omnitrophota bacterium]
MLNKFDPEIYKALRKEIEKQKNTINLIPSENIVSKNVLKIVGSIFTNKYAEGYPGKRYYGGCKFVDIVEKVAIERACKLFNSEHANVQPHSGSQANMAVYFSILKPGDKILAMDISSGGHLTHGVKVNFSGMLYNTCFYSVDKETELINYDKVREIALKENPKLIICGSSSYSRIIEFEKFSQIAKEINAYLLADIAHIAGLIIGNLHPTPIGYADFITSTTHKTLRGPRGGLILCKKEFKERIDSLVIPGIQGGPLVHVIAAKAVAFKEAMTKKFKKYQIQIIKNCKKLCEELQKRGYRIVSGGTDNHLFVIDLRDKGINGLFAQEILEKVGIITNKNLIPFDPLPPSITSGIRIGTPCITSRGMKEKEMEKIAEWIDETLKNKGNEKILKDIKKKIRRFASEYPIYPE